MLIRLKVFLSTMWDLYFFWRFDCQMKTMMAGEFYVEIKKHLAFLFSEGETMPDIQDAVDELYNNLFYIEDYYQCDKKMEFVEKYSRMYWRGITIHHEP